MPDRAPVFRPRSAPAPEQRHRVYDASRGTSVQRGYDRHWSRCRAGFLAANPLCIRCLRTGRAEAAVQVHHVEPISKAPERRLDWSNLMPVCVSCHQVLEAEARDVATS